MIDTKEQYNAIRNTLVLGLRADGNYIPSPQDVAGLIETIEALRDVAKAAEDLVDIEQAHWSDWPSQEIYESERLAFSKLFWDKFNALSDWLKK